MLRKDVRWNSANVADLSDAGIYRGAYLTIQSSTVAWCLLSGTMPTRTVAEGAANTIDGARAAAIAAAVDVGWVKDAPTPRRPRCEACQFARDILADTEESHRVRCTHRAVSK